MLISLSAPLFDLAGTLTLTARADNYLGAITRRVNRTATLDGAVYVEDRGFADGDRDPEFDCPNTTLADYERAAYLQRTYPRLYLSTPDGVFVAALRRLAVSDGSTLILTLMIIERIA